jgi:predicted regulator of Ras-like GTPase activity (Roadblock/LC7/MglB family)
MSLSRQLSQALMALHRQCKAMRGSVSATSDGLVLAAFGDLDNDTAAATAVHITQVAEQHLSLLMPSRCRDQIIWTDTAVWYTLRLADQHMLMVVADADCAPGLLRVVSYDLEAAVCAILAQAGREVAGLAAYDTAP